MRGNNEPMIVVGDSDGLIALLNQEDLLFERAKQTVEYLIDQDVQIIFPVTAITETVTTLVRKLNKPSLAKKVVDQLTHQNLLIQPVDGKLLLAACYLFQPQKSKQNTLFDAVIAATCEELHTKYIFSFDKWYAKLGYVLVPELAF